MYYQHLKINHTSVLFYKAKSPHRPVIFEMHGGGFMFGSASSDAIMCHRLRNELDINVVSIDYTLSTVASYPTQLNEVYNTMLYFYKHALEFDIDPHKFMTLGHSAGANLATSVCLKVLRTKEFNILLQILDYPYLDLVTDPYQKTDYPGSIAPKFMQMFREKYCPNQNYEDPLVSPIKASKEELSQLPPAVIVLAEYDSLKDEGLKYANLLAENYVETHFKVAKNKVHAFMEKYFSASREIYTKYSEERIFIWIKGLIEYYCHREF